MTYKDQFVVEVKCRGKILRVVNDEVRLPFGSEYSLYLKNLNSRRASVNISIDGEDVLDYQSLILEPNSSTELEGFLRGTTAKNRFKFINKTKEIADHRGDKADDGIIRVEFAYEKTVATRKILHETHHHYHSDNRYPPHWNYNDWFNGDSSIRYSSNSSEIEGLAGSVSSMHVQQESLGVKSLGQPLNDEGITVKGSEIHQDFNYGSIGELEQSEVIVIRLKGITGTSAPVQQPITVKTKLECPTCGRKSRSDSKFCSNCGTFLQ